VVWMHLRPWLSGRFDILIVQTTVVNVDSLICTGVHAQSHGSQGPLLSFSSSTAATDYSRRCRGLRWRWERTDAECDSIKEETSSLLLQSPHFVFYIPIFFFIHLWNRVTYRLVINHFDTSLPAWLSPKLAVIGLLTWCSVGVMDIMMREAT
jgi:hypothetical protein